MLHRQPLIAARVVDQPNRFTVRVLLDGDSGRPIGAYLANTGNLRSILRPGAEVRITPAPRPGTKLPYHLVLARQWGRWVAVDANTSAHVIAEGIEQRRLPGFRGWRLERREPPVDGGRLDLLLRREGRRLWMEVKCTTLLRTLIDLVEAGEEAAICFVAQRGDARAFRLLEDVDPLFAATLTEARVAGVQVRACRCRVTQRGVSLHEEIPVLG
jgi:sugar fermentation stimulation protein A